MKRDKPQLTQSVTIDFTFSEEVVAGVDMVAAVARKSRRLTALHDNAHRADLRDQDRL